jgi:ribosomal protein S18 acetylase RimI-like enzyme
MPFGGTLSLKCNRAEGKVIIRIEDTGIGIAEDHLENIFTPFFTTKDPGKGSGLGLSITHQLVNTMGGRINVKSKHREGTSFTITFPVDDQEKQKIRFVHATTPEMIEDVFYIQRKILIGEKGYKEETIHRPIDELAYHILAYRGLQPVGTVTCIAPDVVAKFPIEDNFPLIGLKERRRCLEIDRLAVIREARGSIIPLGLMTLAYLYGKSLEVERLFLDVFSDEKKHIHMYNKLGFNKIGEYKKPLPVTVMMLDQKTDYEKTESRMNHFVKPLMKRLMMYMDFEEQEKATFIKSIDQVISEPEYSKKK